MPDDKWLGVSKEARKFSCIYCRNGCRRYYAQETGKWMHEYVVTTDPYGQELPEGKTASGVPCMCAVSAYGADCPKHGGSEVARRLRRELMHRDEEAPRPASTAPRYVHCCGTAELSKLLHRAIAFGRAAK